MKIVFKKDMGQLIPYSKEDKAKIDSLKDAVYVVDMKDMDMRTILQNSALHKYFSLLSEELNSKQLTIEKTMKVETYWTPNSVKELLWRPIQKTVLAKNSTTTLKKKDIDKVYDVLNKALGIKLGIYIPFPNKD